MPSLRERKEIARIQQLENIKRYQPILAVRLDNEPDDLWQIPLLVRSINPDYRLYVRRYAQDCCGALLYVVPAWRCLG